MNMSACLAENKSVWMKFTMRATSIWKQGRTPELELVFCCARTHLDEANAERIREILRGRLSWPGVLATAFDHHLECLLYENLTSVGGGLVPGQWLDQMRENARKTGGMAVLFSSELLRICEIFNAGSVPLIPYKGPILGWLAYRSLTRRRFLDLDFFVPQSHLPRAAVLLQSAGYDGHSTVLEELTGRSSYAPGQYGFSRKATRTQIELHTERTLRYFPVPLDFEKMSQRLITLELCGQKVRTFSIEDSLVMLCVHGAKHFWERFIWLVDVAELTAIQPVDWSLTLRIAKKLRSTRLLLLGLYLAHELLDAPVPEHVLEPAQQDSNVRWLAASVRERLTGGSSPLMGVLPRTAFRFRSRDGLGDAVRHTLRLATMPTEHDPKIAAPFKVLAPLYRLVRPWKLLREHGVGLR